MGSSPESLSIEEDSHHPVGPPGLAPLAQACIHLLALLILVLIVIGAADACIFQSVIEHQPLLWEVQGQLQGTREKPGCEAWEFVWLPVPEGLGPVDGPRNPSVRHTSGTWESSLGAVASHIFYLHLDPEPVAEADAAGAVPCGAHAPDQGEDEPGLNQLWDAAQLFRGYLPEALGTVGTASGPGQNSAE